MDKIVIEIDEIVLMSFEPNSFLDRDSLEEKKFTFTAIFKSKGIDQLIMFGIILTLETPEKFTWNPCWCKIRSGAYGMNKELDNQISKGIVSVLKNHSKEIYPLSHMNNKVFSEKLT